MGEPKAKDVGRGLEATMKPLILWKTVPPRMLVDAG